MQIQIDSREKAKAITKIINEFELRHIDYYISKLWVGDYMSLDNPRLIIDRKQNLTELCSNVCQQHERFKKELARAQEAHIQLIILVEHGKGIAKLEDVIWWKNPRSEKRVQINGKWTTIETKAMKGEVLYKILSTLKRKYGVRFEFCNKNDTGRKIIELLGGKYD